MLYTGVEQGDWHAEQIILPAGRDYNPEVDNIILIDFAFSRQRLGDEQANGVIAQFIGNSRGLLMRALGDVGIPFTDAGPEWDKLDIEEI